NRTHAADAKPFCQLLRFTVFHDWPLVHVITRPASGLSVHDLMARENGNWLRLMVSRCPGMGWTGRAPALPASTLEGLSSRRSTMFCRASLTPQSSPLVLILASCT